VYRYTEGTQFFSAVGDGVEGSGSWRGTPLHAAARHGRSAAVAALLTLGARPDAADPATGRTALHAAAKRDNAGETMEALLRAKLAGASARDCDGRTPLHAAAKAGSIAAIRRLAARGGRAAAHRDARGRNALHLALKQGHVVGGLYSC
jgi:ankyrin repeat protein